MMTVQMDDDNERQGTTTLTDERTDETRPVGDLTRPDATPDATSRDDTSKGRAQSVARSHKHTLTLREVLALFDRAGLARTPRSIERYCKDGKLDAFFDSDERIYYVTPESVERLIVYIKEVNTRQGRATSFGQPPTPPPTAPRHAPTARDIPTDTPIDDATKGKVKELETKVQSLEIDKRVRDQIIDNLKDQIRADREHFTERLEQNARRVGELQTKLLQLEGPRSKQETIQDAQVSEQHTQATYNGPGDEITG